jgi:PhoPQ-activated pathogenicity-related protein
MRLLGKMVLPVMLLGSPTFSVAGEMPAVPADLANYVAKAEPDFAWTIEDTKDFGTTRIWRLKMTSQVWQGIIWTHDLLVAKPAGAPTGKALLLNEGGGASVEKAMYAAMLAAKIKAPVALLFGIPNQPLLDGKSEDDLIAETFIRYLDSGDASWPLLFPMVKSVVKAMDALQEFSKKGDGEPVTKFIIGGASKRGWTTWLTAASDPRVMAITPMVIDVLNMRDQLTHQQNSLGGTSKEISPYTRRGLTPIADTVRAHSLWTMVDPWTYRDRFTMPKLIILANNDPFWSTDALNLYWDALPGEKYISYTPNSGHDLIERDTAGNKLDADRATNNMAAFIRYQLSEKPMPKLVWKHTEQSDGSLNLTVTANPAPRLARLWIARSETRDFRKARWESQAIELKEGQPVTAAIPKPERGFIACYADLGYQIDGLPQWLCTQLRVIGADAK